MSWQFSRCQDRTATKLAPTTTTDVGRMAAPEETGPDVSTVSKMLGPLIPVHIICAVLLGMRIYTHSRPVMHLGWDDVAVALAMVSSLSPFSFLPSHPTPVPNHLPTLF